jgi:hypothetical protein
VVGGSCRTLGTSARLKKTEWELKLYNWCRNQSIFLSEGVNLTASVTVAPGMAV